MDLQKKATISTILPQNIAWPPRLAHRKHAMTSASTANDSALVARLTEAATAIRRTSVTAVYHATSGHPGGALSSADLFACIYGAALRGGEDLARDRFVLSKGHGAPALYATGAQFGLCSVKEALSLRKLGSKFQGHPH